MGKFTIFLTLVLLLISGCTPKEERPPSMTDISASWAYSFVIWDENTFVVTEEEVNPEQIEKEIGEVKQYFDREGTYGDGFSNIYPVGTKLYKIKEVVTSDSIAVETQDHKIIKANYRGK